MENIDKFLNMIDEAITKHQEVAFEGFVSGMFTQVFHKKKLTSKDFATHSKPHELWKGLIDNGYVWNKGNKYGLTKKGITYAKQLIDRGHIPNPNNIKLSF